MGCELEEFAVPYWEGITAIALQVLVLAYIAHVYDISRCFLHVPLLLSEYAFHRTSN